ncbi:MAG TPA: hypothetical protein VGC01_12855 [Mucilaginibacter sp.]
MKRSIVYALFSGLLFLSFNAHAQNFALGNLGVEGNVYLNYKLGLSNILIEGGDNYGFFNIQKGPANGKNNTGAVLAAIGYSYWFDN